MRSGKLFFLASMVNLLLAGSTVFFCIKAIEERNELAQLAENKKAELAAASIQSYGAGWNHVDPFLFAHLLQQRYGSNTLNFEIVSNGAAAQSNIMQLPAVRKSLRL